MEMKKMCQNDQRVHKSKRRIQRAVSWLGNWCACLQPELVVALLSAEGEVQTLWCCCG